MSRLIYCYAECHYAECRYAKCPYNECHGATTVVVKFCNLIFIANNTILTTTSNRITLRLRGQNARVNVS